MSPALAGGFLTTAPPGKPKHNFLTKKLKLRKLEISREIDCYPDKLRMHFIFFELTEVYKAAKYWKLISVAAIF